ncbi:MAG: dephospho-CoA kinase [Candidatus Aquicultor primus]|jgi:dephospho-CoA kinase|uniref:Dephospho-CoA kinase n=1 Tax=Candidatus Aquicultor primus TaxID=1797195 RepID=A0A1F2UPL0_9ACTN|nr:MAG: dephospho-CoA kinase [Candidatus Aquicultor primus]
MKIIGVTGPIASGKSAVTALLKEKGAHVIDADIIAREVVEPGRPAWTDIVEYFGESVLRPDQSIDRPELGRIVFGDAKQLSILNEIVHPRVMEEVDSRLRELAGTNSPDAVVVIDVPLLIEVGMNKRCAHTVLVIADEDVRLERLLKKGLSREEAESRVDAQHGKDALAKFADMVIVNNGTLDELKEQTEALWKVIQADSR